MKTIQKSLSVIIALSIFFSFFTVAYAGNVDNDILAFIKSKVGTIREYANDDQDTALKSIEDQYNTLLQLGNDAQPWASVASGKDGAFEGLITQEILDNTNLTKYIELELMRNRDFALSSNDAGVSEQLNSFKSDNDAFASFNDLTGLSLKEICASFSEFKTELSELYISWRSVLSAAAAKGITITFSGGTFYSNDDISALRQAKVINIVKDINALLLSSKDTWEAAFDNLLSAGNIHTLGIILGEEFADTLADDAINTTLKNYLLSDTVKNELIKSQTTLLNGTPSAASNKLYTLAATIANGLLEGELAPLAAGIEGAGWTVEGFLDVLKYVADYADTQSYSRLININLLFSMYMDIYTDTSVAEQPVLVDGYLPDAVTYDIKAAIGSISSSLVNLINPVVLDSQDVTASSTQGLKFVVKNNAEGEFVLRVYRSGGPNNVYGFLKDFDIKVENSGIRVQSVSITSGSQLSMYVGDEQKLSVSISPGNATNKSLTWSSSNSSVASVSSDGKVTGKLVGNAVITVTSADGASDTISVTVKKKPSDSTPPTTSTNPVNPGSSSSITNNELSIEVPSGTVQAAVSFVTQQVNSSSYSGGEKALSTLYELKVTPSVPLLSDITISFDMQGYDTNANYFICLYDENTKTWIPIDNTTLSSDKSSISGNTKMPGVYALFAADDIVFQDLAGHWSRDNILSMYFKGYVTGYSVYEFGPDKDISRAEFAAIVYRILGLAADDGLVYNDTASHWANTYISTVSKLGYMIGYDDGNFRPDDAVTREQIVAVLIRALYMGGANVNDGNGINDRNLIEIMKANDPSLDPELLAISFNDSSSVSDWALDYIKIASSIGALQGYDDNTIRPLNNGTRAESAVLAERVLVNK